LIWFLGLFLVLLFVGNIGAVKAQYKYTCDACGYCQNTEDATPSNWSACAKCLYNINEDIPTGETLNMEHDSSKAYTVFGCLEISAGCDPDTDPDCTKSGAINFVNFFLNFFTLIVGGLSFMTMLYGGAKVMLARGDPDAMNEGKRYVYGAILGLIVVASSVLIVKIIGGSLLQIPFLE